MKLSSASIAVLSVALALAETGTARSLDHGAAQATAQSSAPTLLRFDGRLTTPTGEARTGTVLMVASLYAGVDDPTPLWAEQQLITLDETGRYTIVVGATLDDGVPKEFFLSGDAGSGHWLGIGVQGEAEQPRVRLVSVPYALKAREAETLSGKAATDFVLNASLDETVKSAIKAEGGVVSGVTGPGIMGTAGRVPMFSGSGDAVVDSNVFADATNAGVGPSPVTYFTPGFTVSGVAPGFAFRDTDAGADAKTYDLFSDGNSFFGRVVSDSGGVSSDWLNVLRNGTQVSTVSFPSGDFGFGTTTPARHLGPGLTINGPTPGLVFTDSNAGPDAKVFDLYADGNSLFGRFVSDTGGVASDWLMVSRSATTVTMVTFPNGNMGIGTINPTAKLHVAGSALVTGNVTVDGNIAAKYQDVAEWVETPAPLESGTVVIVDPVEPNRVVASSKAYDTRVAGAVSAQPGLILGERGDTKTMVAQSGRVRIKADATYGAIKIGDLLVTSGTPGYAMLSKPLRIGGQALHRPGTLLGKALEALPKGKGEILVLLTLQ